MAINKIIEDYVKSGGRLFAVINTGRLRDGGTEAIKTNAAIDNNEIIFYIHKDDKTIHYDYPTTGENVVDNKLLEDYLILQLENYIQKQKDRLKQTEALHQQIKRHGI